jgi:hypothetical protein
MIYYEDQARWTHADFRHLFMHLDAIFRTIGPNAAQLKDPDSRSARFAAKRYGRHDDEIAAIDLSRCTAATLHMMKAVLVVQGRLPIAVHRFENLSRLDARPDVINPRMPIIISAQPSFIDRRLTDVAIHA